MIAGAAALGVAPQVVGVLLHATSDAAFGAPRAAQEASATPEAGSEANFRRATAPLRPDGRPTDGGTVTIGSTVEPDSLHPWVTQDAVARDVLSGVMDGLLRYDSEQRLQPALAVGFDLSDDGRTYTFALREGVSFHDGSRFSADDFLASWRMLSNRPFAADNSVGWDKIEAVDAPDAMTVVVRTIEPYAPFLSTVATTPLCPASALAEGVQAFLARFDRAPVGTGPLRLAEWSVGERIELRRFDGYWGDRARLDRVEVRFVPDVDAQLARLGRGAFQLAGGGSAVPVDRIDEAERLPGTVVVEHGTQNWQHLDLKQIGPLRETRVRQALDFATPRERIIDGLLDGRAVPAFADQAPGSWAYDPSLEPRPYLPERAADLLDQADFRLGPDGLRRRNGRPLVIELWGVEGDPLAERIIGVIAESWNGVGVVAVPRFGDPAILWGPMGYQFSDQPTAALYTWTNANDPDNTFYWHSSQIPLSPTAGGGNLPAFFYPYSFQEVIDALTAEGAATFDRDERREIYGQIQELLAREVPVIFLYWERAYAVAAANLGGFWPSPFTNLLWNVQEWYLVDPTAAGPESEAAPAASPVAIEEG